MILCLRLRFLRSSCVRSKGHKINTVSVSKPCSIKLSTISAASNTEKSDLAFAKSTSVNAKPFSEIPTDNRHWATNALEILFTNGGVQKSLYKIHEKIFRNYGEIVKRKNVNGNEVYLCNPADVAAVFRAEPKYPRRFKTPVFDDFYARRSKEPGVFFLNGEKWQKHKRIMSKIMLRPPQINQYIPRVTEIASEMVSRIGEIRNSPNDKEPYEVNELDMELFKWSFETVTDFLFDYRFGSLTDSPPEKSIAFIKAIGLFLDSVLPVNLLPPWFYKYYETKAFKTFDENFLELYKFADELIEERLDKIAQRVERGEIVENGQGVIPFLLSSKMVSENEISSSIVDTLFAGVDTTSNTMQWMLYLLAKNPEVQSRVRDEVLDVLPNDCEVDYSTLQQLHLVKSTMKETLRLYPVLISTGRILEQDVTLSGYHVPANTSLMVMNYVMGRREDVFENALEFLPERWLRSGSNKKMDAFASIPFGHGVRMCLGRRLAELELQILLAKILKKFNLCVLKDHIVEPRFRGVTIPDKPIRVQFIER